MYEIIRTQIIVYRVNYEEYRLFLKEDPHSPLAARVRDALAKLDATPSEPAGSQ